MSVAALASAQAGRALPAAPQVSMTSFNDRSMPCFHEQCTVKLQSGQVKTLLQLAAGDVLCNGAAVLCKVRTLCPQSRAHLVKVPGGLLITPWHPMHHQQAWVFPCEHFPTVDVVCNSVISVVLHNAAEGGCKHDSLIVNGVAVVALGHDIANDPVASHPYFGTDAVIGDLKQCVGWQNGEIVFRAGCLTRAVVGTSSDESLISGFRLEAEVVMQ